MSRTRLVAFALFASLATAALAPTWAGAAPKRLVFKEEFVVEGDVQKPEVAVFISRQNLNKAYDLELKESFLPKIIESVDKEPF